MVTLPFRKGCLEAGSFPCLYVLERTECTKAGTELWLQSKCNCTGMAVVKQLLMTSRASMENRDVLFLQLFHHSEVP